MSNKKMVVCVVDGITTAILLSILFNGKTIDICIIEEKDDNFSNKSGMVNIKERVIIDLILEPIKINQIYTCRFPNITLVSRKTVSTWITYYLVHKKVKQFLSECCLGHIREFVFYGAITSTFMFFLPRDAEVKLLDHGVECLQRQEEIKNEKSSSNKIRDGLCRLVGYNAFSLRPTGGYTLANSLDDSFVHISYQSFENSLFKTLLQPATGFIQSNGLQWGLFLPETQDGYNRFMKAFFSQQKRLVLDYEKIYSFIMENAPDIDILIIKFHPAFYLCDEDTIQEEISLIKSICKKHNIICYHIDDIIGAGLGRFIPAEILLKYLKIDALMTMYSTTALNVATSESKLKCINYSGLLGSVEEAFAGKYEKANPYITACHFDANCK